MPVPRHADRVAEARQSQPGRQVALIIIRRIQTVRRNLGRREANPLRARSAVDIAVEPGMVPENGKSTADNQQHQQKVSEVGQAQPGGKTGLNLRVMQLCKSVDMNRGQAEKQVLPPSKGEGNQHEQAERDTERWTNPQDLTPILGIFYGIPFRTPVFWTLRRQCGWRRHIRRHGL